MISVPEQLQNFNSQKFKCCDRGDSYRFVPHVEAVQKDAELFRGDLVDGPQHRVHFPLSAHH